MTEAELFDRLGAVLLAKREERLRSGHKEWNKRERREKLWRGLMATSEPTKAERAKGTEWRARRVEALRMYVFLLEADGWKKEAAIADAADRSGGDLKPKTIEGLI